MKGVIFCEFLELVEEAFGEDMVEDIIEDCDLSTEGSFTSVGNYPYSDLVSLVVALSKRTSVSVPQLIRTYANHLFTYFTKNYPSFVESKSSAFDFLDSVDQEIHVEVLKLYPDAKLPRFICERDGDKQLVMDYQSPRPFADLAHGLIGSCIVHYDEDINIEREDLKEDGTHTRFVMRSNNG